MKLMPDNVEYLTVELTIFMVVMFNAVLASIGSTQNQQTLLLMAIPLTIMTTILAVASHFNER